MRLPVPPVITRIKTFIREFSSCFSPLDSALRNKINSMFLELACSPKSAHNRVRFRIQERGRRMSKSRHAEAHIIASLKLVEAGRMWRDLQPLLNWNISSLARSPPPLHSSSPWQSRTCLLVTRLPKSGPSLSGDLQRLRQFERTDRQTPAIPSSVRG